MKHVFLVHSPITAIIAELIIAYENIPIGEVLILLERGTSIDKKYLSFKWPYTWPPDYFPSHYNIFKSFKKLWYFDKYVDEITNAEPFILYVPHTRVKPIQLLISKSNCLGFNIMEEGLGSYKSKVEFEKINSRISLHEKIAYLFRIKNRKFIRDEYNKLYSISSEAFPGYERKVVLSLKNLNSDIDIPELEENSVILVFDAVSIYKVTEIQNHIGGVIKLLTYFEGKGYSKIYFKLHPAQINSNEAAFFRKVLNSLSKIYFEEIPSNISLENIVKNSGKLRLYVNISSLGYYAKLFNKDVFSYAYYIAAFDTKYADYIDSFPLPFKQSVRFLD